MIASIRELKPDIIWVGISTPRQERFMMRYGAYCFVLFVGAVIVASWLMFLIHR